MRKFAAEFCIHFAIPLQRYKLLYKVNIVVIYILSFT